MMRPFFLKCHPDVQVSPSAKLINLGALQSINGLMDTVQATCDGKVVEWPSTVGIEFVVTVDGPAGKTGNKIKAGKKPDSASSRRKVELKIPHKSLRDDIVASTGPGKVKAMNKLQRELELELAKILKVAGLPTPRLTVLEDEVEEETVDNILSQTDLTFNTGFVAEDDIPHGFGRTFEMPKRRPRNRFERSREEFMSQIDPKKIDEVHKRMMEDFRANLATKGLIKNNPMRRRRFISSVLSRVRVDKESNIGVVEQVIAIRRLSLLLEDNFEKLMLEEMGKMWEDLVIILKDPRGYGTSSSALHRRRKRNVDTGFKFTLESNDRVIVHVPIDFRDEELLQELDENIWDFFNLLQEDLETLLRKA